jgi:hypothetical protein
MQQSLAIMKTALRVLTAINEKGAPRPEDVNELRGFAPDSGHLPPDELACEVIQAALKRRAAVRRAAQD